MSGKDAKPGAKTTDAKNKGKDSKGAKAGSDTQKKVNELCIECKLTVSDDVDALQCSFCNDFIHLDCDCRVSKPLYDALVHDTHNVLVYLCMKCKPMILPDDAKSLWGTFISRVDKHMLNNPKREPLADKIMNKMSEKIECLDHMVKEHKKALAVSQTALTQTQTALQETQSTLTNVKTKIDTVILSMHDRRSPLTAPSVSTDPKPITLSCSTQTHQADVPQNNYPPPLNSIICGPTNAFLQQYPNQTFGHQPPPPFPNRPPFPDHFPPLPQSSNQYNRPFRHSDHATYPQPPYTQNPRPAPHPQNLTMTNPDNAPNTDTTIIVYNTDKRLPIRTVVEDLMLRCEIYNREVIHADSLVRTSDKSPLYINCNSRTTKWIFLRELNKLRNNVREFSSMYARPYLNKEDLRNDRNLVRQLNDLRSRYRSRQFKIQRGEIKELINDNYVTYTANLETDNTSITTDSYNSLPAIERIVDDTRDVQAQSSTANSPQVQRKSHEPKDESTPQTQSNAQADGSPTHQNGC